MLQDTHHHPQNMTPVRKAGNSSREEEVNLRGRNLSMWHFCCCEFWSKGKEEIICFTIPWKATADRKSRQELTTVSHMIPTVKTREMNASLLLFLTQLASLSLILYRNLGPRNGTAHSRMDPPTPINNQDNPQQIKLVKTITQLSLSSQVILGCCNQQKYPA